MKRVTLIVFDFIGNSFIEIEFTPRATRLHKACRSMVLGIFTELCNHYHNQFENVFIILLKKNQEPPRLVGKGSLSLRLMCSWGAERLAPCQGAAVRVFSAAGKAAGDKPVTRARCCWEAEGCGARAGLSSSPTGSLGRDSVYGGVLGSASPTPPDLRCGPWHRPCLCTG